MKEAYYYFGGVHALCILELVTIGYAHYCAIKPDLKNRFHT